MANASPARTSKTLTQAIGMLIDEKRIRLADDMFEGGYSVYILRIDSSVWKCPSCSRKLGKNFHEQPAFYVGITNKPREERMSEHLTSWLKHQGILEKEKYASEPWKRGAKITRHHGFSFAVEYEPIDDDGYLFDGRLTQDDAKLLEQIVIPTALRTLGFAAYAGVTEKFSVEKDKKGKAKTD